jgi:hypothetical protein
MNSTTTIVGKLFPFFLFLLSIKCHIEYNSRFISILDSNWQLTISFYVSIKIMSYTVDAWQLHNNLLLDFVFEIKKKCLCNKLLFSLYFSIDYGWQQWWWVLRLAYIGLFFPGVSSMMMMMVMMMTGARVERCNKSALLRERKTTDKMNV